MEATPTTSSSWFEDLTSSTIYSDLLKPYAQAELGIPTPQDEAKQKAYENTQQNTNNGQLVSGISNTNLLFAGIGIVAVVLLVK